MDEITNAAQVANEVIDNAIVKNFADFQEVLSNSGIFQCDNLHMKITNDIGTVTVPMLHQHMADDFLKELTNFLDVNILYAYKELDGSIYRIVAYTMPYHDEMYIVFVDSQQYGIVDEMHVAFFESLDVMFGWLRKGYDDVVAKQKQIDIIQIQDLTDLYRNFV
jgi:hypothetical protein